MDKTNINYGSSFLIEKFLPKNVIFFKPLQSARFTKKQLILNRFVMSSVFLNIKQSMDFTCTKVYTFMKSVWNKKKQIDCIVKTNRKLFFSKYYYNGLGYKIFLKDKHLFIWVGLTHYTILKVPENIKIFAKKRRIFIIGWDVLIFNDFLMKIRRIRKIDLYKGKGLLEVKSYKGFIRMKSGKKKQY